VLRRHDDGSGRVGAGGPLQDEVSTAASAVLAG
jgi:hypothetical protein